MRAHKRYVQNGELQPAVFCDHDGGMSVSWQKYATAINARRRARVPHDNGIISFERAGDVRAIGTPALRVEHAPDIETRDRSHAEVFGDKKAAGVRVALLKLFRWQISVEAPVE